MRRVLGPVLTTGVALVVAGVVVANPIIAPRADVQIPAVKLSAGNDETGGMLDPAFLNAIAPGPSESDNPFAVLKQLITSFAVDATSLGKNAIVDAFVAGVAAVSEPELTATSIPYFGPPIDLPPLTESLIPDFDLSALDPALPNVSIALSDLPPLDAASIAPGVKDFVSTLVADASYVGDGLVAAAFAVGAVVAAEPRLIAKTLESLVRGDFDGALKNAIKVVTAPLGPPIMVLDTLLTLVESHLGQLPGIRGGSAVPGPATGSVEVDPSVTETAAATKPTPGRDNRRTLRDASIVPVATAASARRPSVGAAIAGARGSVSDSAETASARGPVDTARDAITAIGEQAGAAIADVANAVDTVAGRARGARAASAGN